MKMTFWSLLQASFLEVNGWLFGIVSLAVTFAFYRVLPETQVPFYIVVALVCGGIFIIVTFANALSKALRRLEKESAKGLLPKIVRVYPDRPTSGETLCLLEPSKLLSSDVLVSFYYTAPEGLEVAIGAGVVTLVQNRNDFIQTQILDRDSTYQNIWDKLNNNDAEILSRVIVKPAITRQVLSSISNP